MKGRAIFSRRTVFLAGVLILTLVGLGHLRIGYPDENAEWVNRLAGGVPIHNWGAWPGGGTVELQLLPTWIPVWMRMPVVHVRRIVDGRAEGSTDITVADNFGRVKLLGLVAGAYQVARGRGWDDVDLESVVVDIREGETKRLKLVH